MAVPADDPVTTPVVAPIAAMARGALDQVPPGVASVRVMVAPTQTESGPVMGAGLGLTVMSRVRTHPVRAV